MFFSIWRSRPRLLMGMASGVLVWLLLLLVDLEGISKGIIAFDAGALVYLGLAFTLMRRGGVQQYADTEDEGSRTILLFTVVAAAVSLTAIVLEMNFSQHLQGAEKTAHVLLTVLTIFLSWLFTHTMFALHYARLYYRNVQAGLPAGLIFPEADAQPDYWDFLYFACIIGTSGQTADVSLSSSEVRRIGLVHCVLAFFYNVAVLSLMINIASGLIP